VFWDVFWDVSPPAYPPALKAAAAPPPPGPVMMASRGCIRNANVFAVSTFVCLSLYAVRHMPMQQKMQVSQAHMAAQREMLRNPQLQMQHHMQHNVTAALHDGVRNQSSQSDAPDTVQVSLSENERAMANTVNAGKTEIAYSKHVAGPNLADNNLTDLSLLGLGETMAR